MSYPTVSQLLAASFPEIVADKKKAANQWAENALLDEMERQGMIDYRSLGQQIEAPLDFQQNATMSFLSNPLDPLSLQETEVLTSAVYSIAMLSGKVTWTKMTEVQNPSKNQKIAIVDGLISNLLSSHDDKIEAALFATSTSGFLGLPTHMNTAGTGTDGGIDASTFAFWRNAQNTYVDDTDIEAALTATWNTASKGSGSKMQPTLLVSDGATNALFEGTQQAIQRYSGQDFKAGAKSIYFKTAPYIFSQYGTSSVFMFNKKNLKLIVSKEFFRERGETQELQNANGYTTTMFSALQLITDNRSRNGVVHV